MTINRTLASAVFRCVVTPGHVGKALAQTWHREGEVVTCE